jgi:hypothetical protein
MIFETYKKSIVFFIGFIIFGVSSAQSENILVVYPKTINPIKKIYNTTIKGIEKKINNPTLIEITESTNLEDIEEKIINLQPKKVIALGKNAVELINKSSYKPNLIASLIYFKEHEYNGVSLIIDSRAIIDQLHKLIPKVNKIFFLQDKSFSTIKEYKSTHFKFPMEEVWETKDLHHLLPTIGHILEHTATPNDAIIVPANIPDDILYEVSKIAWDKKILLISTKLSHLEYGVMLVFYPNMTALGKQIGELSSHHSVSYETIKTINTSLNKRVSEHLGINFSVSSLSQFSIVLE